MFKKFGFTLFVIIFLFSANISLLFVSKVFAEVRGGKELNNGMVWRLDLTKEQKEKISAQEDAVRKNTLLSRQSIRDLRNQLNAELSSENPDKVKINSLIDSISKDMTYIQKQEVSFMLWMREQLTPDQKQKLLTLIKNREQTGISSEEIKSSPQ